MMAIKEIPGYVKATFILLLIFLIFSSLFHAQQFLVPFTVACLFAFLLNPISMRLERWGTNRVIAIIISILIAILVVAGLIFFFSTQIMSFRDDLPELNAQLNKKLEAIQSYVETKFNVSQEKQEEFIKKKSKSLFEGGGIVMNVFSATGTFIAMTLLIPIYIFFLTFYKKRIHNFIIKIANPENYTRNEEIIQRIARVTQSYLAGLLIDIAILSVLNTVGFLVIGLKHAVLLGVTAAILNIIPYVGVLIGSIFPVAIALLTKDSLWSAAAAAGVCIVVQFLDNNFITPKVVGSSVNLNPLATLIVLIVGGTVWGVAGMMLFIPLLGMLKVVFDNVESLQPYGYLIGEEKDSGKFSLAFLKRLK